MRKPANVFEGLPQQAAGPMYEPLVKLATNWANPDKNEAFRRLRREKRILVRVGKITDEKSCRLAAGRRFSGMCASLSKTRFGRGKEPITLQAP